MPKIGVSKPLPGKRPLFKKVTSPPPPLSMGIINPAASAPLDIAFRFQRLLVADAIPTNLSQLPQVMIIKYLMSAVPLNAQG